MAAHDPGVTRSKWTPVAVASLGCMASGSLYGWSALAPALAARFGITHAQTGQTFSLAILAFTFGVLVGPRLGPRNLGMGSLVITLGLGSITAFAAARAGSFGAFLAFYSLGFGTAAGVTYIIAVEIASRGPCPGWGVPLVVAAFGLGGAVFGVLLGASVGAGAGLRALDWVATALASAAALTLMARGAPALEAVAPAPAPATQLEARLVLRLWVIFAAGSLGGLVALGLAQPIAADRGAGSWLAAAVVVVVALGNVSGRLGAGLLAMRLAPELVVAVAQAMGGLALAILLVPTGAGPTALLMTGVALGYGLTAASIPLLTRRAVGPTAFAGAFSIIFTGWGAAGLVGPWLAGGLRDRTGSWEFGLALSLGGSVVALAALATGRWTRT